MTIRPRRPQSQRPAVAIRPVSAIAPFSTDPPIAVMFNVTPPAGPHADGTLGFDESTFRLWFWDATGTPQWRTVLK